MNWLSLFCLAVAVPILVIVANPVILWLSVKRRKAARGSLAATKAGAAPARVGMITVFKNPSPDLIEAKLNNSAAIEGLDQVIFYHDGPANAAFSELANASNMPVSFFETAAPMGKNAVLNQAVEHCSADIIIFSDADSLLQENCAERIRQLLANHSAGGVCGQRVIAEKNVQSHEQSVYIALDSRLKQWESELGQITSNDGKLYAIRKDLCCPIPDGVTDDLYNGLSVIRAGERFIFDPTLTARIRVPSRNLTHEIDRRRRIVCRSLRGLWANRALFNPRRYGFFAIRLFINKVLRRFIPHAMLVAVVALWLHSLNYPYLNTALSIAIALYLGVTVVGFSKTARETGPALSRKALALNAYVIAGLYGTLIGTADFLAGRTYVMWTPKKS